MRYLSLFDGIGAACVAWQPLRWECVGVSEIEAFPIAVTKHHRPHVPHLGDITKITEDQIKALGPIDLIVGGFPCVDLSIAGARAGLRNTDGTATRSGLFFDAMRIVQWAREHCGLRWLLVENVPGMYSSNAGRDFASVVGAMAGTDFDVPSDGWRNAGVAVGPSGLVEWATLDAQYFDLAQRRERAFVVADFGDWSSRPPIFSLAEGMSGNPAPSRETVEVVAGTIAARTRCGGGLGTDFECDGGLIPEISHCLNAGGMGRQDYETETMIVQAAHTLRGEGFDASGGLIAAKTWPKKVAATLDTTFSKYMGLDNQHVNGGCSWFVPVTHTLRGEGFDASEDGTGRGTPIIPVHAFACAACGEVFQDDYATSIGGLAPAECPRCGSEVDISEIHPVHAFDARQANVNQFGDMSGPLDTDGHSIGVMQPYTLAIRGRGDGSTLEYRQDGTANALLLPNGGRGGIGVGAVTFSCKDHGADAGPVSPTLRSMGHHGSHANGGGQVAVAFAENSRAEVRLESGDGSVVGALSTGGCEPGQGYPTIQTGMMVRRITPKEAARLQGFPDTYLDIVYRGRPAADGPKYKAIGNSMAVTVMAWIGKRIDAAHRSQS